MAKKVSGRADCEQIISHLQIIRTWAEVDRKYGGIKPECCDHIVKWIDDALELLKEQEPVKPVEAWNTYLCGNCNRNVYHEGRQGCLVLYEERYTYCPNCGRKVKWDGKAD